VALGTFIVGAYTGTLASVALGMTDEGFEVQWEPKVDLINKSDVFGDALLDLIYRGCDWFVQMDFKEWKTGPLAAAMPWGAGVLGVQGVIGRLGSDVATALVLTATAGTPAATTPASLTAAKAILAPNSNPKAQFSSRLRTLPVRMVALPVDTGSGVIKSLTVT
jgi:hypothetical protein